MKEYFAFQWHITDDCDQRCKHCYIFANNAKRRTVSMTWKEIEDTFYNCLDFCEVYGRAPYFYITGGDPLLHADFWKLAALLHAHGAPFAVLGNPFHLNENTCKRLSEYGCRKYQLSIDGMRDTHDWFRKPGSFDCTLDKIKYINDAEMRSVIMTTVSGRNIDEVPDIIDTIVDAGASSFAFARWCPTGGGRDAGIAPLRYRALLDECYKKFRKYEKEGCPTYFCRKDHLWTLYEYEEGIFKIPADAQKGKIYGGCNCGNCHITVTSDGRILACRRADGSDVGRISDERLADVWMTSMESFRNFEKFEKCSKCELLAWCRGCPAAARAATGDFYGADPQCWKEIK